MDTQKSLEAIRFAVRNIFDALKVQRCAAAMGVAESTAYTYQNDQDIPLERLLCLLAFSRDQVNAVAAEQGRKIVTAIAQAAGLKVIDATLLEHFNRGMDALNNGGKLHEGKREQCPHCRSDLFTERTPSGVIVYVCKRCFGAGINCQ